MSKDIDLVLVHGLLGSLSFFKPENYLPNINVLCPDLHGYGKSPLKNNLTLLDQVDYLKQYLQTEANSPCWLLGHSVGGAVVTMFAAQYPDLVAGIINVEGNFTIKDAFWCQSISEKNPADWEIEYLKMMSDPEKWLSDSQVSLSSERVLWAKEILAYQDAATVQAVAKAVVNGTDSANYVSIVSKVMDSHIPVYLLAGQYSLEGWDIPDNVRNLAKALIVTKETGHMMMLENPTEFCSVINDIVSVE